ncbi:hypothetical protein MPTK1_8g12090 [Marchantia polymorpha subsp. ruderalis]|uniref:Plastidal glycolate/glycerate translocator 1, chloroplastic n=2 Tax=Marchantia polymorpha TaxID=3197 RepID=A0A176W6J8_MARPO|nr:hypothetical protein AXG93_1335s1050 [Marchantia polymorpha subsp. ruderalis]PTQ47213.1 hypothetical protein MARPO_0008s0007 [Marchantia polymorpha]BBN19612.1 hypothetical protein Mp_8g12090 [Marchantia polymorpha subsp. ruderalis]|eukprot:PTQ47213.1 hypothetical protein MARPO_0008s0007 [Marchantia polymorpha]
MSGMSTLALRRPCSSGIVQSSIEPQISKMQSGLARMLPGVSGCREFLRGRQMSQLTGNSLIGMGATGLPELRVRSQKHHRSGKVALRCGIRSELPLGNSGPPNIEFGSHITKRERPNLLLVQAADADPSSTEKSLFQQAAGLLQWVVSLGLFLALDMFLKQSFVTAGIKFPSALFGMFCIFTSLVITDLVKPEAAAAFISFFQPGIMFIQRWLPLFYVPSLVVVPLAIQGIPTAAAAKITLVFVVGWMASLAVAGYTTVMMRNIVKTVVQPAEYTPKPPPFSDVEFKALAAAAVVFLAVAVWQPTAFGTPAMTTLPYFLSATALGYVFGTSLPADFKKICHPIITCAVTADLAAFIYGKVTGVGFEGALKYYMTKQAGNPGAGDIYMGFLGSVILSFAFSMFRQRVLVKRHAAEIFSAVIASSLFSMYSTAAAGRLIGLSSNLTLAVVPRCITVALALPIAGLLEAGNPSLTAAVVVLTGLIGANFGQALMDKLGFSDPITRGMATATSAHGLGTAALSAKEPEALPFCAIAYALTGICCSILVSVPAIQQSLLYVAGHAAA